MNSVSDVADTFFNGDFREAFQQGLDLGFNVDEIANFSVDFNLHESHQQIREYREIAQYGQGEEADSHLPDAVHHGLQRTEAFFESFKALTTQAQQLSLSFDGNHGIRALLQGMIAHDERHREGDIETINQLLSERHTPTAEGSGE